MRRIWQGVLLATAALTGCTIPPATRQPMDVHVFLAPKGDGERAVVFLPGRKDRPLDFVDNGFLEALWRRHPAVDAYIPDAHLGFYAQRTVTERLHADVFEPLRARGYREIMVVGVSMGGLGALLYAHRHPQNLDAITLVAPYLGEASLISDVRAAGGPRLWDGPGPAPGGTIAGLPELWGWLGQWPEQRPDVPIVIAYGEQDRFATANAMLGELLPAGRTLTRAGGHRWVVWRDLWQQVLAREDILPAVAAGIAVTR